MTDFKIFIIFLIKEECDWDLVRKQNYDTA